jgi:hypothetical protein
MHATPCAMCQACIADPLQNAPHIAGIEEMFVHSCTNHKAAISLTSWVRAHERFEKVRDRLGLPLCRCAPRDAREMSNLLATQSKEIVVF